MSETAESHRREGDAHYEAGRYERALDSWRAAQALDPDNIVLHFNVGNALRHLKRPREAITSYDAALVIQPRLAMAHHNKATCLLQVGDLAEGFREYEWRKACPGFADDKRYALRRPWRGEDIQGQTLYIYPELFQGDLLQFCRYALFAQQIGARVVLAAPPAMISLLQTMSAEITLISDSAPPPEYDYQSALMTLPALLGTTLESVPSAQSYLRVEPKREMRWRSHIGARGFKIGIAWQGSALASQRSFPLALAVDRLKRVPGIRLISLQKHNGLEQLEGVPVGTVETLGEDFDPGPDAFLDTAAAMSCCDLFITPDTSVAHLAGALGIPTWLALPFVSDWRWLEDRADTPWYPKTRLFRQQAPGNWASIFDDMSNQLEQNLSGRRPPRPP